jgi:hypothetical protein
MICVSCGAQLKDGAKFCRNCGTKVMASSAAEGGEVVSSISLAPLPTGLAECPITIREVSAEGPDDDDDLRVAVKYEVTNNTEEDWEYLVVRAQILTASGQIVDETRDMLEQTVTAGESAELEANFSGIKAKVLGKNLDRAHVTISAVASGVVLQKLGEIDIPDTPYEVLPLKPTKVGDVLQLVSGSLWRTDPDSDMDVRIEARLLVQNLTTLHLPEVRAIVEISDKAGREFTDATGSDEVRPGDLCVIGGSGSGKDRQFKGAKAALVIRAYWPLAAGIAQKMGISAESQEDDPGLRQGANPERWLLYYSYSFDEEVSSPKHLPPEFAKDFDRFLNLLLQKLQGCTLRAINVKASSSSSYGVSAASPLGSMPYEDIVISDKNEEGLIYGGEGYILLEYDIGKNKSAAAYQRVWDLIMDATSVEIRVDVMGPMPPHNLVVQGYENGEYDTGFFLSEEQDEEEAALGYVCNIDKFPEHVRYAWKSS